MLCRYNTIVFRQNKFTSIFLLSLFSTGGDDFLVVQSRDDFGTLHGTTPYTHSSPGTPINMPWLGGVQTGRGAAVVSLPPLCLPSGAVDVCSLSVFFSSAVTLQFMGNSLAYLWK